MDEKILITVGRQIGSGGLQVARLVAKELGVDVYDKNLLMMYLIITGIFMFVTLYLYLRRKKKAL